MTRLIVLLLTVAFAIFPPPGPEDEDCAEQNYRDSTYNCVNGATCVDGVCECLDGWQREPICGWGYESCGCMKCTYGNMTNPFTPGNQAEHVCECFEPDLWEGVRCETCKSKETCRQHLPDSFNATCDKSAVVVKTKDMECRIKDPFWNIVFGESYIDYRLINDEYDSFFLGNASSMMVVYGDTNTGFKETFYCGLDDCIIRGEESNVINECKSTWCGVPGHTNIPAAFKRIIENVDGEMRLVCGGVNERGSLDCVFFQDTLADFFGDVSTECEAGECIEDERPIITQEPNYLGMILVGAMLFLLVLLGSLSCYLYRQHQKRYQQFPDGGAKGTFVEMCDDDVFGGDTVVFSNVGYRLNNEEILMDVNGIAHGGQVLAIIGASGAGKTTLLDILAGRKKTGHVRADILLNGFKPKGYMYRRISAYVEQEAALLGTQTVRELLLSAARLRLPETVPLQVKKDRILAVAADLGIASLLDRRYGDSHASLSGGEKRRVQIAYHLMASPSIIFLDEPTSGLDSYNALELAKFLRAYAERKNKTIILSIHQPRADIFFSFHKVCVLAAGRVLYFGPTSKAAEYFTGIGFSCPQDFNVADFILDVAMKEQGNLRELEKMYKSSRYSSKIADESAMTSFPPPRHVTPFKQELLPGEGDSADAPLLEKEEPRDLASLLPPGYQDEFATSVWTQAGVLAGRAFTDAYRHPLLLRAHILFMAAAGLLVGGFFWNLTLDFNGTQNRLGLLLFLLILLAFASLSTIGAVGQDRIPFLHERAAGFYHPLVYYVIKVIFHLFPLRLLPTLIMGSVVYLMASLQQKWQLFLWYLLVLVLFSFVTSLICLTMSMLTHNPSLANFCSVILLLFMALFQGVLVSLDSLPSYIAWVSYVSPFRYAMNTLMVNELDYLEDLYMDPLDYEPTLVSGRFVLTIFGFDYKTAYAFDCAMLCVMIVSWFLIGGACFYIRIQEIR
eukprot:Lithocolla_globosa_v1_NODE_916_length_3084_cov_13.984483.p1 type:complete len:960 gc:universal NODE_916_length_3084_cov_13.984483:2956-77(-)